MEIQSCYNFSILVYTVMDVFEYYVKYIFIKINKYKFNLNIMWYNRIIIE